MKRFGLVVRMLVASAAASVLLKHYYVVLPLRVVEVMNHTQLVPSCARLQGMEKDGSTCSVEPEILFQVTA